MSRGLLALILLAACGAPKPAPKPVPIARAEPADAGVADMTPAPGDDVLSLDELAARGAPFAMRELKRASDIAVPIPVDASQADTCFRAVVGASRPVRSWFADANGIRGEIAEHDGAFLVPPRGPVCAKKGEALRLVVMAPNAATITRAVVFASP